MVKKAVLAKEKPRDQARRARTGVYRRHILEAAERVFAERGFEAAKLQEISKGAGVSMGTIYAIFPGKEELFRVLLEERGAEIMELARAVFADGRPPFDTLDALVRAYVGYFVDHPSFLRMHLRLGTSWVLGPASSAAGQVQLWQDIHELQADLFRRGIEAGLFVDEDPAFLAKIFSAMDQVLLSDWVAGGMKATREDLARRLLRLVERAFVRPGAAVR
jgi:AcrR family transcriptional regulator